MSATAMPTAAAGKSMSFGAVKGTVDHDVTSPLERLTRMSSTQFTPFTAQPIAFHTAVAFQSVHFSSGGPDAGGGSGGGNGGGGGAGMCGVPGFCHHHALPSFRRGADEYSQHVVSCSDGILVNPRHAGSALHAASHASSDVACSSFVKFPLGFGICRRCSTYVAFPVSNLLLPLASSRTTSSPPLRFPVPQNH